jgi:hypothetical protein
MPFVSTVYGRPGPHVVAEAGDYDASQIENDSSVAGDSVADAQNALAAGVLARATVAADLGGTPSAPVVTKVQGRPVQDIAPGDGDILTWSEANSRWEPKPQAPTTPSGYAILKDINFMAQPNSAGNSAAPASLAPYTETIDGVAFTGCNPSYAAYGEGTSPLSQNVNGSGYRVVAIGATFMRSGASAGYLVTDIRTLAGYVAGRKYGCLAVLDYALSRQDLRSMAYVGCFQPAAYYPGFQGWVTQNDSSGFGCGAIPRGDISLNDYKPVISCPVSGTPLEDVPSRSTAQFQAFTHPYDYIFGTLRRASEYAEGVAGPYSGAAPSIEKLMTIGSAQTMWAGSMDDLRWGVCWKGFSGFPYRHQQYCYVRRMIFYQSKE